jgi:hypothetical protein
LRLHAALWETLVIDGSAPQVLFDGWDEEIFLESSGAARFGPPVPLGKPGGETELWFRRPADRDAFISMRASYRDLPPRLVVAAGDVPVQALCALMTETESEFSYSDISLVERRAERGG